MAIVLALFVVLSAPASTAFAAPEACTCGYGRSTIWDYVEDSEAVFAGVVASERAVGPSDVAWQIEVTETFKGNLAPSIEVLASDEEGYASSNWCREGLGANAGQEAVFFGTERDGALVVDRCDPLLSTSDLELIIAPAAQPDGSGEAWAVGLGWQDDANLHVLDGEGRRLAAARVDATLRSGVQCEGSTVVAIDARDDEGPIILRFDVVTMIEVDRLRLEGSNPARPLHCDEDTTVFFARISEDGAEQFMIDSISSEGSNSLVSIDQPENTGAESWPFAVIAPANGDIEPVQIIDLRTNSIVGLVEVQVDREVDRLGFVNDASGAPTSLWVTTVNRERGLRQVNEIIEVDLVQTPLDVGSPITITDQLGPVQNYLQDRVLLPVQADDSEVQWFQADGTDLGRQSARDRVPGRNGEIVATSAGVAFLDSEGTARIVPPFGWNGSVDGLIALADQPTQVNQVLPPPLFSAEVTSDESASNAEPLSYVVDLPTVEVSESLTPEPDSIRDGEATGSEGAALTVIGVATLGAIGIGLFGLRRRARH